MTYVPPTAIAATILSDAAPPPVANDSAAGTSMRPSRSDHTHKSSLNAARLQVSGAAGQAVWTFVKPYPAGTVPICTATAETPANAAYINVATIAEGLTTNTTCTIIVQRVAKTQTLGGTLTALLGAVISVFGVAPAATYVNVAARVSNP